jgi:ABC-2 type transport system ATP-binding protein
VIKIDSLSFGYGKKPLFSDLSLELPPGSVYGLLGLNGAGKTSLLKLMAGALRPVKGSVEAYGRDPGKRSAEGLPDDPDAPAMKPAEWVRRYSVFRPKFDRAHFERLMEELALEPDKLISRYSFGQRKKFALAAAIASGARTLLLDEPTNGLDIPSKGELRRLLAGAGAEDRVVVISTHQVRDLESLFDPLIIVHGGKILFTLSSEQTQANLASAHVSSLGQSGIVYAQKDAVGYSVLLQKQDAPEGASAPDTELIFNAAISNPARLERALNGERLGAFEEASK